MLLFTLLVEGFPYFEFPIGLSGWAAWFMLGIGTLYLAFKVRRFQPRWKMNHWIWGGALAFLTPVTALFFGLRLPAGNALPPPNTPLTPEGPALMVLSALPWMIAAGTLGPWPGALLAALSGGLIALFDGHSLFEPLIYAVLAMIFSVSVRQRYRTITFRLLSHPLVNVVGISLSYMAVYIVTKVFMVSGSLPVRLDYAFSWVDIAGLAFAGQVAVAALAAEVGALAFPGAWGRKEPLEPSPAERSLQGRLMSVMGSFVVLMIAGLMIGVWVVAGNASRRMLQDRMQNTAHAAGQPVSFALETGQALISQLAADERLYSLTDDALIDLLIDNLRATPYFHQLTYLDAKGNPLAGFPIMTYRGTNPTPDERLGVQLALQGVTFQSYTLPPEKNERSAGISFIAVVKDAKGIRRGILLARTKLSANPFTQPILENLDSMSEVEGTGILLDEAGVILYHPEPEQVGTYYTGEIGEFNQFIDESSADGTRQMVYSHPVEGRSWTVITTVPIRIAQQAAMDIAVPLLGALILMGIGAYMILSMGVRRRTKSLQQLAEKSGRIAAGDLDHSLEMESADEIGQLSHSLEQMRVSLKDRMEEINRLLFVSQGVASALEMETAVTPILEGALTTGAASARLILTPAALPEYESEIATKFGLGKAAEEYSELDGIMMEMSEQQGEVVLTNPARAGLIPANTPPPSAVIAVALKHEEVHYGALWLAFDEPHKFDEEEKRFINAIASQAALAAANARLYQTAQIGRKRVEAILSSTPDPVLVTDHRGRLILANPAAISLLKNGTEMTTGTPIEDFIHQEDLINLLKSDHQDAESVQVSFPNNRVYNATASPVLDDGQIMGRVCVLSDITQFKELDALKTDFVSTVSHDLRSPLTLMRGYATMLQMVGDLNEQQTDYVSKMVIGVESMSRLVNNLLDLGRIEAGVGLRLDMVPPQHIITQVIEGLQNQAAQREITVVENLPSDPMPLIEADQALLQQAIYNLVDNAIKYSGREGRVELEIEVEDDLITFIVRDTGMGIAPVDQPRLFERFFRVARRESRKERGSGLGLAIVKSIAERHGGGVRVESHLGRGSVFYMTIPVRQPISETETLIH